MIKKAGRRSVHKTQYIWHSARCLPLFHLWGRGHQMISEHPRYTLVPEIPLKGAPCLGKKAWPERIKYHHLRNTAAQSGLPRWCSAEEPACQCRRRKICGFNPGSGRSPGGGIGNPLQHSCLETPLDRGASWATKRQTWLSTHTAQSCLNIGHWQSNRGSGWTLRISRTQQVPED